jgi:hypothetical protein
MKTAAVLACFLASAAAFTTPQFATRAVSATKAKPAVKRAPYDPSRKAAPAKAPVKKVVAPVKKVVAKAAPVKKAPVKKAPVKAAPVKKAPVKKFAAASVSLTFRSVVLPSDSRRRGSRMMRKHVRKQN